MRTLISLCAACLMAGAAWAQQDNPDNPHSTQNKDRSKDATPQATTNPQIQATEPGNPTHTHAIENDAAHTPGAVTHRQMDAAESQNPDSVQYKDRDADHDGMMANATPEMMLNKLHHANLHEIEAGRLAEQKGSDQVKEYGRMLQKDHQAADEKVMALAKKKNISLADQPMKPEMAQKHQAEKDELAGLSGAQFDKTFAGMMVKGHEKVIHMAQMWKQNCKDQDICSLIDELMPKLQQHRQTAEKLRGPMAQGRSPAER